MPFLRAFVRDGVRAPLRSTLPPLTPPAWTSLMTGKRPGQHGVFDFFQKETPETEYFRFSSSADIRSATIWSLASDAGKRVISLNFPLMFPAPPVNGFVVPGGWMPWRQLRLGCHPPGLFDLLKSVPSFNPRELAFDMVLEAKAIEGCDAEEYADWIALHTRRERRWFDILTFLMREEPADLVGVVFDGVDKLQHLCWRFLDPSCRSPNPSAWELEITAQCEAYFHQLDQIISELVGLADDDTTVVLASDHGFGPNSDIFCLNVWLEQNGYLKWSSDSESSIGEMPQLGFGQMTRHVYELDWEGTIAYAATPSSQGIHIVRAATAGRPAMSDTEYFKLRSELAARLQDVQIPTTGQPLVTAVRTREEAFAGPYEALSPDLSLELNDGVAISILRSNAVFQRRSEPKGNHRWDGIFLAGGRGIRSGVTADELSILDVAPLILYNLDLPVPTDLAGRMPVQIIEAGEFRSRPPRSMDGPGPAPPEAMFHRDRRNAALEIEEEEIVVQRLRALGYVE